MKIRRRPTVFTYGNGHVYAISKIMSSPYIVLRYGATTKTTIQELLGSNARTIHSRTSKKVLNQCVPNVRKGRKPIGVNRELHWRWLKPFNIFNKTFGYHNIRLLIGTLNFNIRVNLGGLR